MVEGLEVSALQAPQLSRRSQDIELRMERVVQQVTEMAGQGELCSYQRPERQAPHGHTCRIFTALGLEGSKSLLIRLLMRLSLKP